MQFTRARNADRADFRMPDAATEARELVRIVSSDTSLSTVVRHRARTLGALAGTNPDLALTRLTELRAELVPRLPTSAPTIDYVRCVGIEVYWRRNLAPARKAFFATPEDYRRAVEAETDPAARLLSDLGPDPIVPAANSWLLPLEDVKGLSGAQTKVRLNIAQDPPYVVLIWTVDGMLAAGVTVRAPCGLDAIPSRLLHWYPENVPNERIDGDLPRKALERIEWRP